jgi:hypothetical protein
VTKSKDEEVLKRGGHFLMTIGIRKEIESQKPHLNGWID